MKSIIILSSLKAGLQVGMVLQALLLEMTEPHYEGSQPRHLFHLD